MRTAAFSPRTLTLIGSVALSVAGPAWAQETGVPAACAGLASDSAEAAILGCNQPSAAPPVSSPEPAVEPIPEALRAPLPEPDPVLLGDAAVEDLEPTQAPPARSDHLVALFADWLERHPLGETIDPAEAKLLDAADLPAGLPPLPPSRRYAELDGMIVEIDPETEELLRLVRRTETADGDLDALPDVAEEDSDEPRESDEEADVEERAATQQAEEERERLEALARDAEEREQQEREAAERVEEEQEREEERAREEAERERDEEEAREQQEREAAERAQEERKREEERAREAAERERDEEERQDDLGGNEAQAFDIPNGHMPPPGSCRVWFPDREPGQQPPPTSCAVEVPDGAVLIQR